MDDPRPPSADRAAGCDRLEAVPRNTCPTRSIVPAVAITRRRLAGGCFGMSFVIGFGLFQGMHPRAAAASGPANGFAASLAPLPANPVFYDSGKARGANAADIPLAGTTTAPDGTTIEARLVRADTLAEVHPWQAIATASAGVWSGNFLTAQRSPHRLRAEVRVASSSAAPARTVEDILIGHIAMLIGQSEDHLLIRAYNDNALQTTPTLVDAAAADSVFLMQWSEGATTFAANGIQAINPANRGAVPGVTRSMVHLADVLTRNAPGEKFLFIAAVKSGTAYSGLVDDRDDTPSGDDRPWSQTLGDALTYIRQWGADVGVLMSTWTAAPSTIPGGYRVGHYPIFAGLYADTPAATAVPAYGAVVNAAYCPAGYRLDHGFWDLSGQNRPQAAFDAAVTKMAFHGPHRFEDDAGLDANKQDCRGLIRAMVADPVLAPIMLPKGPEILTYQNGFPVAAAGSSTYEPNPANWAAWADWAHPTQYSDDGLPARARHTAVAMLYAFGLGPAPAVRRDVPRFNRSYWDPAGAFVQLWYEDALGATPRLSTTRRERSEAAIPATYPHRTEVAGFYRNNQPCTSVVIAAGATTGADVVQINAAGVPFTYADKIDYGLGGASGVVQWPQDAYDGIWKNLPIAVTGLAGVPGLALEPMPDVAALANPLPAPQFFAVLAGPSPLGPYFKDPSTMGAGVTAFTVRMKIRCKPATATRSLFYQVAGPLKCERLVTGTLRVTLADSGGIAILSNRGISAATPDNQWKDLVFAVVMPTASTAGSLKVWDGVSLTDDIPLPAASGYLGELSSIRNLILLGDGLSTPTRCPPADVETVQWWKGVAATSSDISALGNPTKAITGAAGGTIVESPTTPAWRV